MEAKEIYRELTKGRDGMIKAAKFCFDKKLDYPNSFDGTIDGIYYQSMWKLYQAIESGATLQQIKEAIELYQQGDK